MILWFAILLLAAMPALAHGDADWIAKGGYQDPTTSGASCCGPTDCHRIEPKDVLMTGEGYIVTHDGHEYRHGFAGVQWSETRDFFICLRPNKTVRCFFAPPVGA